MSQVCSRCCRIVYRACQSETEANDCLQEQYYAKRLVYARKRITRLTDELAFVEEKLAEARRAGSVFLSSQLVKEQRSKKQAIRRWNTIIEDINTIGT